MIETIYVADDNATDMSVQGVFKVWVYCHLKDSNMQRNAACVWTETIHLLFQSKDQQTLIWSSPPPLDEANALALPGFDL